MARAAPGSDTRHLPPTARCDGNNCLYSAHGDAEESTRWAAPRKAPPSQRRGDKPKSAQPWAGTTGIAAAVVLQRCWMVQPSTAGRTAPSAALRHHGHATATPRSPGDSTATAAPLRRCGHWAPRLDGAALPGPPHGAGSVNRTQPYMTRCHCIQAVSDHEPCRPNFRPTGEMAKG